MRRARSTTRRFGWRAGRPPRSAETTSWNADDGNRAGFADASIGLRLGVFLRRRRLDRQIATGCAGHATPMLELRILQLTDARSQRMSARSLRRLVEHVDRLRGGPDRSTIVVDRVAISASREGLLGLADRLDSCREVSPLGMVLVRELIRDGVTSPLYGAGGGRALIAALWKISDALGGDRASLASGSTSLHP